MVAQSGYEKYKQQGILTASAGDLVVMLYEGCIKQLKLSSMHIESSSFEEANKSLIKAQDIISELIMGLDFRYDISNQLLSLYDFIIYELIDINITKDVTRINPVIDLLAELRDTWVQVIKLNRANIYASGE